MPHLALSFDLGTADTADVEAACFASGALAITFGDARDDAVLEPAPGEVRLWPATRVTALYAAETSSAAVLADLAIRLGLHAARIEARCIADRVWEREWLQDFHAMRFGQRLWICPRHEGVSDNDAVVVQLDPGLAFGTGTHPSTALCLEWLDAAALADRTVIDYGCGSGVLAIAAARLGAASVAAFDIDPQALLATQQNAAANDVAAVVAVCESAAALPVNADVLLANILAGTLIELAARFAGHVRPGGALLLAGILAIQAEAVTTAYKPWFDMDIFGARDGWVALRGTRCQDR
ncbi:MAG: 50S ribosomal protein L11 methyltransferase [Gammaproteobacteria bacterium]|nr:50S ribosomal protein L11 methyltransferase [Gammaproteobacteria bacterium]